MRSQKIDKNKKPAEIPKRELEPLPHVDLPPGSVLRTVHFVEVGDMPPGNVQFMMRELNNTYNPAEQGVHFMIPVRHGKIGTDIVFEEEFINVVERVCEVVNSEGEPIEDAKIQLTGGAKDVTVVRTVV